MVRIGPEPTMNIHRPTFQLHPHAWQYMAPPFVSSPLATPPAMIAAPVPHHPLDPEGSRGLALEVGGEAGYFDSQYPMHTPSSQPLPDPSYPFPPYPHPPPQHEPYEYQHEIQHDYDQPAIHYDDQPLMVEYAEYNPQYHMADHYPHPGVGELDRDSASASSSMSSASLSHSHSQSPMAILDGVEFTANSPSPLSEEIFDPGWVNE